MTIKEAVINYLNEQSTASDFSLGDVAEYAESLVREAVLEWADENGYDFDEFTSVWYKPDVPAHAPLNK